MSGSIQPARQGAESAPVGLNVYVLRGAVPQVSTADIFRGIVPFLYVQLVNVAVIMLFPQVVLWLPRTMGLTK